MQNGSRKSVFEGSETKEAFLDQKNVSSKINQNLLFFKLVSPWFLSKNRRLFNPYFLCKMDEEKVFFEGFKRKESFLDQKNIGLKNHQNLNFLKRFSPWFLSICTVGQEKMFFEGSEIKEDFLDHKNIGSKNHPNLHFFKEVSPWFLSKKRRFFNL